MLLIILCISHFLVLVTAAPTVTFSINSQIPPVARVGDEYVYQFTATTFSSTDPTPLQYALLDAPTWLYLDSDTRTLSGIPATQDLGSVLFSIQGTDSTGSSSMQVTLLVVVDSGNITGPATVTDQLSRFGDLANANTLTMYTSSSFSFSFALNTFQGAAGLIYYATSADRSPLPSWIKFQPSTLSISGLTPPLTAIPQTFGVTIIATTVQGYAGASFTFYIVISEHRLAFIPYQKSVAFVNGSANLTTILENGLQLDGEQMSAGNLTSTSISGPSWLSYDAGSSILSGSPPNGTMEQAINLTAVDVYGDTVNALVHIQFPSSLFAQTVGLLSATIGQPFNYTFPKSLFSQTGLFVNVNLGSASSWLTFSSSQLTLSGVVPSSTQPSLINANITASLGSNSQTQDFHIFIQRLMAISSRTSDSLPTGTVTVVAVGSTTATSPNDEHTPRLPVKTIVGVVIGCVVAFLVSVFLILCCMRRWKRMEKETNLRPTIVILKPDQTLPDQEQDRDLESYPIEGDESSLHRTQGHLDGVVRRSKFSILGPSEAAGPSNPMQGIREAWPTPLDSGNLPQARRTMNSFEYQRAEPRLSSRISQRSSLRSLGVSSDNVAVGLGHGRSSYQRSSRNLSGSSIQPRWSSFSSGGIGPRRSNRPNSYLGQDLRYPRISEEGQKPLFRVEQFDASNLDSVRKKRDSFIRRRASSNRENAEETKWYVNDSRRKRSSRYRLSGGFRKRHSSQSSSLGFIKSRTLEREITEASLAKSGRSGGSSAWEDIAETTDRSISLYEEHVNDGEDIVQAEAGYNLDSDPVVATKRRGELARMSRLNNRNGPYGNLVAGLAFPPTPSTGTSARDVSIGQDSVRSEKMFL